MLKIEMRQPKEGLCEACAGTGIVIPKNVDMPIEVGNFCTQYEEGVMRWEETLKRMNE